MLILKKRDDGDTVAKVENPRERDEERGNDEDIKFIYFILKILRRWD